MQVLSENNLRITYDLLVWQEEKRKAFISRFHVLQSLERITISYNWLPVILIWKKGRFLAFWGVKLAI